MDLTIDHYEPENDYSPYETEYFDDISDFKFDTDGKEISFTQEDGKRFHAKYSHRIAIKLEVV